jgi:hypothetical protein
MQESDEQSAAQLPHALEDGGKLKHWLAVAMVVLVASPVLYVLSIGPAYHAKVRNHLSDEAYYKIYAPIHKLGKQYDPIEEVVQWYAELWI